MTMKIRFIGAHMMQQLTMQTEKFSGSQEQKAQELMVWCDLWYTDVAGSFYLMTLRTKEIIRMLDQWKPLLYKVGANLK
jgi:hypothetical protein